MSHASGMLSAMTPADIRDDETALRYVLGAGLDLEAAATRAADRIRLLERAKADPRLTEALETALKGVAASLRVLRQDVLLNRRGPAPPARGSARSGRRRGSS